MPSTTKLHRSARESWANDPIGRLGTMAATLLRSSAITAATSARVRAISLGSDPWVLLLGTASAARTCVHHGLGKHNERILDPRRHGNRPLAAR